MKNKIPLILFCLLMLSTGIFAQDKLKKWQTFDFSKQKITKVQLAKFEPDDLQLLRGIVFGKRGRIFKEQSIQKYLAKQSWYKPKETFSNAVLSRTERANIDVIREAEADRHDSVKPGDLRFWQKKEIPDEKLYTDTAADWRVMIAEVEAIHGKTFADEPWLQKYFEERYWYQPNANYNASVLTEIERKNLEKLNAKRNEDRKVAVSFGDMDKFQNAPLTEELLRNMSLNDLRLIRNEFMARRGKLFVTPGFKQYFEWQDWYKPLKDQSKVKLNPIEEANVKLIETVETREREKMATDLINEDKVTGLFVEDLRVLRNEIYARHGRIFKDAKLQKYFAEQKWYQPNPEFKDPDLNDIEVKNLAIIRAAEETSISKFAAVEG